MCEPEPERVRARFFTGALSESDFCKLSRLSIQESVLFAGSLRSFLDPFDEQVMSRNLLFCSHPRNTTLRKVIFILSMNTDSKS
jgi:hypothetical protein